ncbi:MAG: peptidyl-prolyl cis-trans isomerase [Sulfitobacter litoralis]|jgi:peptidyl-prolyl cis-trans isomerase D|uniref:peptidylprolyl isomerase n=1 Tax=Sulfitobacter TaxID=60136 RepID=UPI001B6A545A|nr:MULTISPECIES: peptidyl-prolyl cis-trans isomerase [Sulfitobacter]MBQ0767193.1 peptidyl-prolyl cis-trans isomerase [Sulfitobacter litoralis]MBQ0803151.1 peptidyl-prolyl cis-trans isomerase [Sulfitobacter litoralis]MCF7725615.1 peptidylprolyl isomerase [Sulfitobacter sp. M22]MCF7777000.1 peptidylprolyl isomerase [Sulfitobacter sp. M220]
MKAKGNSFTKTAVWGLMGLLILGLGGFGAVNLNGSARTVGEVGDKSISVDNYARELQQQIRAIESQSGEQLSFQEAQAIGLDRAVLQRLVRLRALDNEADEMGLSIGDTNLRERVVEIPSFQGVDGNFDREGYRFALQQAGLNENEFEQSLREEAGRTLLQQAITGGVSMPEAYANTLVSYVGEQRSFTWAKLTQDDLDAPLPDATDAQLRAFYDDNADRFMLPASKTITYITMGPQDLLDEVELTDEELQAAYDDRADEYIQPERRLIERLVFRDQEATDQAAAALEVDGTTFEALVADRGLSLSDVDLGDLSQQQLGAAGDAVFNAEVGDIVGPLPSNLGPALFRVNGVLPSLNTTFEEARPTLVQDLAADRAARLVEVRARDLDDQLAGGATLEQIAEDSKMTLSTIEWTQDSSESIAAYAGFREAATRLTENDFPQIEQLDDGSVFAMRLDGTKEERPNPFDAARADVAAAWRNEQLIDALRAKAETLQAELADGGDFAELGLEPKTGSDQSRDAVVSAAPQGFIAAVFDAAPGDVKLLEGTDEVALVRLDRIKDAAEDDRMTQVKTQIAAQLDDQLSQALFAAFSDDVIRRTAPRVDQQAIDAVHVNFP